MGADEPTETAAKHGLSSVTPSAHCAISLERAFFDSSACRRSHPKNFLVFAIYCEELFVFSGAISWTEGKYVR
jgi:hypothetical protein